MNIRVLIVLAGLLAPAMAAAVTDNQKFEKLLGKTTLADFDDFQKAKVACVCKDDNAAVNHTAGFLARVFGDGRFVVVCFAVSFDATGNASIIQPPCDDFELLTN